jgi:hypothetical protein
MLKASDNFHASEVQFLQGEATDYIQKCNDAILEAASNGKAEVWIDIIKDPRYWKAPDALKAHFELRGFKTLFGGQSSWGISWEK